MINLLPATRTALLIDGDALLLVRTRLALRGGGARTVARLEDFLSAPIDTLRREARASLGGANPGELVLVLPASWCASRPVPITAGSWKTAREARDELIEAYFPFDSSDALTGVLDLTPGDADEPRGALFVAPRREVDPWRDRVEQVLGQPVDEIIPSTMALSGLGLQRRERAVVIEPGARTPATTLSWGRPVEVAEPFDETDETAGDVFAVGDAPAPSGAARLTIEDVGVAAAMLPFVPGVRYRALGSDAGARLDRRIPVAAALALIAVVSLALSLSVSDARYRSAIERLESEMADRADEVESASRLRARTNEMASTIERVNAVTSGWSSVLPDLARAFETVPGEGFVHRVELTTGRLVISGEAPEALRVLESLESTAVFTRARQSGSLSQTQRGLETFNIEARRAAAEASIE